MCAQFNSFFEFVKCSTAFQQYALCFPSSVFWMFVFVVFLSWEYLVCLLVLCFLLCNVYFIVCVCTVLLMSCKGNFFFIVKISTIDHNKGGYKYRILPVYVVTQWSKSLLIFLLCNV